MIPKALRPLLRRLGGVRACDPDRARAPRATPRGKGALRVQADRARPRRRAGRHRRAHRSLVSGAADAHDVVDAGVAIAREAVFDAQALLLEADRPTAELIASTAEELDAPVIVMGQRGLSGLKSALLGSVTR